MMRKPASISEKMFFLMLCVLALFTVLCPTGIAHATEHGFSYFPCPFFDNSPNVGKWGYIDKAGKVIIQPQFYGAGSFREGLAKVVTKNGKTGFINTQGKIIIKPTFDYPEDFHDGMARVYFKTGNEPEGLYGYIDRKGTVVIPPRFKEAQDFSEGLAVVCIENKKCGYIDKTGRFAIEPMFEGAGTFSDGLAMVRVSSKFGYINTTGKLIIQPVFAHVWEFSEGLAAVTFDGKKWGFIDKSGKLIIEAKIDRSCGKVLKFSDGLVCGEVSGSKGFMNPKGELLIDVSVFDAVWDFQEGLAGVVMYGKGNEIAFIDGRGVPIFKDVIMYIDKTGKPAFKVQAEVAGGWLGPFTKDSVAKVCSGWAGDFESYSGCGFINRQGEFTIKPRMRSGGY